MSDEMLPEETKSLNPSNTDVSCLDPSLHQLNIEFDDTANDLYISYISLIKQGSISPFIGTLPVPETIIKKGGGRLW